MAKVFLSLEDDGLIELLASGAVGVIPTDTIYGLVAHAANEAAVTRLYRLKHRRHKPGTVIAASIDQLLALGIEHRYLAVSQRFWPGPVSVETPHGINYLHQGTGRQAFRIPADEVVRQFLLKTGPLQTTSANAPGLLPATKLSDAKGYFGDDVDFYVDGGDLGGRAPSTIVRFTEQGELEVVRQGAGTFPKELQRS